MYEITEGKNNERNQKKIKKSKGKNKTKMKKMENKF